MRNVYFVLLISAVACGGGMTPVLSPPPTPAGLVATGGHGGDGQIALTWNAVSGATSYVVLRGATSGGVRNQVGTSTTTSFTDTGLAPGFTGFYVVRAVGPAGTSADSAEVSATTAVELAPTGLIAAGGDGQIALSWNTVPGATGYDVLRSDTAGATKTIVATPVNNGFIDTGLASGSTRYYVVRAVGLAGTSADSAETRATTAVQPAPAGLSASAANGAVALSWSSVAGATSYQVRRAVPGAPATEIQASGATAFTDTNVRNGVTYQYTVRSVGDAGVSDDSAAATAQPFRELCITDSELNQVVVFNAETSNAPPERTFGSRTGLAPFAMAVDAVHGEIFSANLNVSTVTTHLETVNGNVPPARTLSTYFPSAVAYDSTDDTLLEISAYQILTFDRTAQANAAPIRTLSPGLGGLRFIVLSGPSHGDRLFTTDGQSIYAFSRKDFGATPPSATFTSSSYTEIRAMAYDPTHDELLVTTAGSDPAVLLAFPAASNGPTSPSRTLAVSASGSGVFAPTGIAVDPGNAIVYLAGFNSQIAALPLNFAGNDDRAPSWILRGPLTHLLLANNAIAFDAVHGTIVVMSARELLVFDRAASGNTAPLNFVGADETGFDHPSGIAFDKARGQVLVCNQTEGLALDAYDRASQGGVAPLRGLQVVTGNNTFATPYGVALDASHDEVVVTTWSIGSISIHSRTATASTPALRTISGANTLLQLPSDVGLDVAGDAIVVRDASSIRRYARAFTDGNEAPLTSIQGAHTGLDDAEALFVDNINGEIVVAGFRSVRVFGLADDGDVVPRRVLNLPDGGGADVFVDTATDEMFVLSAFGLQVYARTATGNDVPLRQVVTNGSGQLFNATRFAVCN
jgi:fibronectin type 3 domain-containing protein